MRPMTPLGALVRGAIAGAVGTVAMDCFWYARYRAGGGEQEPLTWEFGGSSKWDSVSAAAQVGRRLYEGFRERPLDERSAGSPTTSYTGVRHRLGECARPHRRLATTATPHAASLGAIVWASDYAILPLHGSLQTNMGVRHQRAHAGPRRPPDLRHSDEHRVSLHALTGVAAAWAIAVSPAMDDARSGIRNSAARRSGSM